MTLKQEVREVLYDFGAKTARVVADGPPVPKDAAERNVEPATAAILAAVLARLGRNHMPGSWSEEECNMFHGWVKSVLEGDAPMTPDEAHHAMTGE